MCAMVDVAHLFANTKAYFSLKVVIVKYALIFLSVSMASVTLCGMDRATYRKKICLQEALHVLDYNDSRTVENLEETGINSVFDLAPDPVKCVYTIVSLWAGSREELLSVVTSYLRACDFQGKEHLIKILQRGREIDSLDALRLAVEQEVGYADKGALYRAYVALKPLRRVCMNCCCVSDDVAYDNQLYYTFETKFRLHTFDYNNFSSKPIQNTTRMHGIGKYLVWQALCADVKNEVFDEAFACRVRNFLHVRVGDATSTYNSSEYQSILECLEAQKERSVTYVLMNNLDVSYPQRLLYFESQPWWTIEQTVALGAWIFITAYMVLFVCSVLHEHHVV